MRLGPKDALIVVDVQNDFCPGGALAVPGGARVIPVLNRWVHQAVESHAVVAASCDWHPPGHVSFEPRGGPWPPHCIRDTEGSRFHPDLLLPTEFLLVRKGTDVDSDNYSAFHDTGLAEELRKRGVERAWIGGLALDVCVRASVLDALDKGFETHLLLDGCRAVNKSPGDGERAVEEMRRAGAHIETGTADPFPLRLSGLFTDLYELTMAQAYHAEGMSGTAIFELFFRRLPENRNFLVAAGLDSVLDCLESLRFDDESIAFLADRMELNEAFAEHLRGLRFSGDVYAVPEGTIVYPNEPLVQVVAPILEAQLVETLVLNQVHFQTVLATKAARAVLAAGGLPVVDFGSRRAHGFDAALKAARAGYLAGASATSSVLAGKLYGIPTAGTLAHSYIQAHQSELQAFESFSRIFPETTLLVDTYDTLDGVRKVIELRDRLGPDFHVQAIRLDSGDLAELALKSRELLDNAGLDSVRIFASSGLDEYKVAELVERGAPIDGFGVGTSLVVSDDAPSCDMAYKLVEYDGRPCTKLSSGKKIHPRRKQVFRVVEDGTMVSDVIALHDENQAGEPLLVPVMRGGRRSPAGKADLEQSRSLARGQLAQLPGPVRALRKATRPYAVKISEALAAETRALEGAGS